MTRYLTARDPAFPVVGMVPTVCQVAGEGVRVPARSGVGLLEAAATTAFLVRRRLRRQCPARPYPSAVQPGRHPSVE